MTVDVNSAPFASTAVMVTTTPTLSVGNVKVMFEGDVVTIAVAGETSINEEESVYGVTPPLMVNTTLRELQRLSGVASVSVTGTTYVGCVHVEVASFGTELLEHDDAV